MSARTSDLNALNPYLQGPYAPVREEVSIDQLRVKGEIPKDFAGAYYRNGPNPKKTPSGMHHWFDGDGMVHAIFFEDGKASYRNRYIRSMDFVADEKNQLKRSGIFKKALSDGSSTVYKNTANTDLIMHAGELMALWYISGKPVRLDAKTLMTIGEDDFQGALPKNVSAHSKVDSTNGDLLFFDYALYEPWYSFGVVDKHNQLQHFTQIELPGPRLPHDMAITENYAIFMDLPVVFTEQGLRQKVWAIHEDKNLPTRFGILPRYANGKKIKWFEFPGCYIYHVINAWEEGDEVILYCCKMIENGLDMPIQYGPYAPMVNVLALRAVVTKWTMNMRTGETKEEQIDDAISEFPIVNLEFAGKKSRFSYHGAIPNTETQLFDGILKYDLSNGSCIRHGFGKNIFGSEPAFAPRLGSSEEDDGYVVSFVTNAETKCSSVLILDARDLARPPLAEVILPNRVPLGFHGTWANLNQA